MRSLQHLAFEVNEETYKVAKSWILLCSIRIAAYLESSLSCRSESLPIDHFSLRQCLATHHGLHALYIGQAADMPAGSLCGRAARKAGRTESVVPV